MALAQVLLPAARVALVAAQISVFVQAQLPLVRVVSALVLVLLPVVRVVSVAVYISAFV